jgi:hypothetical protein
MSLKKKTYVTDPEAPTVMHKVGVKINRGRKAGVRYTATVETQNKDGIYDYLWDAAMLYEKGRINFIVEWHSVMK